MVERLPGESAASRDARAIVQAARWYAQHVPAALGSTATTRIVLLSDDLTDKALALASPAPPQLLVLSLAEYLEQFHPKNNELRDLYQRSHTVFMFICIYIPCCLTM